MNSAYELIALRNTIAQIDAECVNQRFQVNLLTAERDDLKGKLAAAEARIAELSPAETATPDVR